LVDATLSEGGEKCINFEISFGEQKEKVYTFKC
jgi:hypothetical protein